MAAFDTTRTSYAAGSYSSRLGQMITAFYGAFVSWNDARVTRKALSALSDRELEDIGLVRGEIDLVAEGKSRF